MSKAIGGSLFHPPGELQMVCAASAAFVAHTAAHVAEFPAVFVVITVFAFLPNPSTVTGVGFFLTEALLGPLSSPVLTPASVEREYVLPSLCSTLVFLPLFHPLWELRDSSSNLHFCFV